MPKDQYKDEVARLRFALDGVDLLASTYLTAADVFSEARGFENGVKTAKRVRELVREALGDS